MSEMQQPGLVFNPAPVPVMNEDTECQIDGQGWAAVDLAGRWVQEALASGRLIAQPADISTSTPDLDSAAYDAVDTLEKIKKANNEEEPQPTPEEPQEDVSDTPKASRKRTPRMRDTRDDADTTGATKKTGNN